MPYLPNILIVVFTILGFFICLILYKRKKSFSDYTLIILNLICGLSLFVSLQAAPEMHPVYYFLHLIIPYLMVTVFMVYASQLITNKLWQQYYWLYFAFLIPMMLYLFYDIFLAHQDFSIVQKDYFYTPPFIYHFFFKGSKIYVITLCILLLKQLKSYTLSLQDNLSYIEKLRFVWLRHYTIGLILIYSFSLLTFLAYNIGLIEQIEHIYFLLNALVILAVCYLSFHGIRHRSLETIPLQTDIFQKEVPFQNSRSSLVQDRKSQLQNDKSQKIYDSILQVFDETKLFTKRQLKLSDLAVELDLPPHQLSQIINSHYGKPFYDFVANYRVNLLKERLADPSFKQYTILSLGLDCGFNSKASLNRVFKEHTGLTPAQYRKSHLPK